MNKKDLKSGMIAEVRNGKRYLILIDSAFDENMIINPDGGVLLLVNYTNELKHFDLEEYDIVAVYKPSLNKAIFTFTEVTSIWKRAREFDTYEIEIPKGTDMSMFESFKLEKK